MAKAKPKTSSKKKNGAPRSSAKPKAPPASANHAVQVISERALQDLGRLSDQCSSRQSEASGQLGQAIRDAVEGKGLNAVAFRWVTRMRRMGQRDPLRLRAAIDALQYYMDVFKIDQMAPAAMPEEAAAKPKRSHSKKKPAPTAESEEAAAASGTAADVHYLDEHRAVAGSA